MHTCRDLAGEERADNDFCEVRWLNQSASHECHSGHLCLLDGGRLGGRAGSCKCERFSGRHLLPCKSS